MRKRTVYILVLVSIVIMIFSVAAFCDQCVGLFVETKQEEEKEEEKEVKETTKKTEKETKKEEETKDTKEEKKEPESSATSEEKKKELSADLNLVAIFADSKPQGNVFIRIVNNGPDELTKQKILVSVVEEKTTLTDPPTGSASTGPGFALEISVKPGETVELPIGFQFDLTQYKYRYEITIEPVGFIDSDTNNNKAVELIEQ